MASLSLFLRGALAGCLVSGIWFAPRARAADAEEDWRQVTALDAGPPVQGRPAAETRGAIVTHLVAQEKALRAFLAANPGSSHEFEARLRLARLLQIRGDLEGSLKSVEEGRRLLAALSAGPLSDSQRAEVDFAGVTLQMRTMRAPTPETRERLLATARKFQREHPGDRRLGALLAEVATLFPLQPKTMRSLLEDAAQLATDPDLRGQIGDDLKRLDLLGQPLALHAATADGRVLDLEQFRGSTVVVLFFARWSGPSMEAIGTLKEAALLNPSLGIKVLGVSLDAKPEAFTAFLKEKGVAWPVAFDGKGWQSPTVRALGINSLPTAWLVDKQGRLRSLNALESTAGQVRGLLRQP